MPVPTSELHDGQPSMADLNAQRTRGVVPNEPAGRAGPYEQSLPGEYARMLLMLAGIPLWIRFVQLFVSHGVGVGNLAAATVMLLSLLTRAGHPLFRLVVMGAMLANVLSAIVNPIDPGLAGYVYELGPPDYALMVTLLVGVAFEFRNWFGSSSSRVRQKAMVWGVLAVPALFYVAVMPACDLVWKQLTQDEAARALEDPNWNWLNEVAFRSAKFAVFFIVTYLGACLGSFLNVVADSLPRGKGIGLRGSSCPQCLHEIQRIDNLPIFSYLNLGGRCRNCDAVIPIRYLLVELAMATIFGSLFVYELTTGCANVPHLRIMHKGILWVVLYPKWPAISIYLFHCLMMSALLVLSLIEGDRLKVSIVWGAVLVLAFAIPAAVFTHLQPVPLLDHVPADWLSLSPLSEQLAKLLAGVSLGAGLGWGIGKASSTPQILPSVCAGALVGLTLGWQAAIQVGLILGVLWLALQANESARGWRNARPTTVLLLAVMLHHPFWKQLSEAWPSL